MDFRDYVKRNQAVVDFVKDVTPGHIDKYTGTLDYACARFNSILLKLSQHPLKADEHSSDVEECLNLIQSFYLYTKKLLNTHWIFHPVYKLILHYKGKVHIPKIKILLDKVNNY
tara:strand:- start:457 stop:798 length:342 start_codon:yes stop_codon:yes gene_type:complete